MEKNNNIASLAQSLKLPVFGSYSEYVESGMSIEDALVELMTREYERRHEASVKRRVKSAGLPHGKTIDTFKLAASIPHLKNDQLQDIATCRFVKDKRNICALGGQGTGKTHLMAAIGHEAVRLGYTVKFLRVSDMLTMLNEASTEKKLGATMKTLLKTNLICMDELGYVTLTLKKAQLLFDVIAKRSEVGGSIYVTSNYSFSDWPNFLGDEVLTKALVGKLAGDAIVLNMNGEDYRIASKKT
ncbi:MAG: ATP-binding protein [Defluviitaleaceae bacterium]|nr:ATP-binding protein [Defluviitaleaceae bacterium]